MLHFKPTHYVPKNNLILVKKYKFTFNVKISLLSFVFHIFIVLSEDPLAIVYPFGEYTTLIT